MSENSKPITSASGNSQQSAPLLSRITEKEEDILPDSLPSQNNPSRNWAAVAGMILSVVSIFMFLCGWGEFLFGWKPIGTDLSNTLYIGSISLGVIGIIFSSIGLGSERRKVAIIGLICSVVIFLTYILMPVFIAIILLANFA